MKIIDNIKKWWKKFMRECVRIHLARHYGFLPEEITDNVLADILELKGKTRYYNIEAGELISSYRFLLRHADNYGIKKGHIFVKVTYALEFIDKRKALLCEEMILWTIKQGKV